MPNILSVSFCSPQAPACVCVGGWAVRQIHMWTGRVQMHWRGRLWRVTTYQVLLQNHSSDRHPKLTLSTCSKKSLRNPTTDVFFFNWIIQEEDRIQDLHLSIIIHFVFNSSTFSYGVICANFKTHLLKRGLGKFLCMWMWICISVARQTKQTIKKNQRGMAQGKENHPEGGPIDVMEGGCCL